MDGKPKRRWFQFRLSTWFVLGAIAFARLGTGSASANSEAHLFNAVCNRLPGLEPADVEQLLAATERDRVAASNRTSLYRYVSVLAPDKIITVFFVRTGNSRSQRVHQVYIDPRQLGERLMNRVRSRN
jgi:hypothetical protein